jgi:hypothetical protein
MSPAYVSSQVLELLGSLAQIPGSAQIQVRARRFSRVMPTQHAQYYQEVRASFPADDLPATISIPPNPDEIDVTVHGLLPADAAPAGVVGKLEDFVHDHLGTQWDLRVDLPAAQSSDRDFHLNVFMNHASPHPIVHEPSD